MYGAKPIGGGGLVAVGGLGAGAGVSDAGGLAATGFSIGIYLIVGLAAIIVGLLVLRASVQRRER